ncbi:MAG: glycosyltransferase family 4 protein [Bacteroidales bacterium]|nr:glycosyltransferase family 4 protein [Bacteroidales bacterium]MCF8402913.1 glycosyltransferase family 4 protein [Bacteroidales bacterium]
MKKVLVITYYWPPSGGAGVQRWLKFVKYLRSYNWEPIVYTPENPESPANDPSLFKDIPGNLAVINTKVWEPYGAYKKFVGRKKEDKIKSGFLSENKTISFTEKIAVWIRGNLFIPDARKFWIKPSVKYLAGYLEKNPVDAMVSTGPPHSMHLIALGLKKKINLPWLADFRDPWTNIDFYHQLMLTRSSDKKHKKLEKQVLSKADKIVTVSKNWAEDLFQIGSKPVEVITNGYDPDDFVSQDKGKIPTNQFTITHIGSMNKDRNPHVFWSVLKEMCLDKKFQSRLSINLIGPVDYSVTASLKENQLLENTTFVPYLPHNELMTEAAISTLLLLPLNNTPNVDGIIPGKLFEYLALEKPIFCIGPIDGDTAEIIIKTQTGYIAGFNDRDKIKEGMEKLYNEFCKASIFYDPDRAEIEKFSRKKLAGDIARLLNDISR